MPYATPWGEQDHPPTEEEMAAHERGEQPHQAPDVEVAQVTSDANAMASGGEQRASHVEVRNRHYVVIAPNG